MPSPRTWLSFLFCALFAAGHASAAEEGGDPLLCAKVIGPAARLACFDKAFPPAADAKSFDDEAIAKRKRAAEDFGLSKQQMESDDPSRVEKEPGEVRAAIVSVVERSTGERVVTLDNKQVWLLTEVTSRGRMGIGDTITVRKAALGSYMLLTATRIPLRARRVR